MIVNANYLYFASKFCDFTDCTNTVPHMNYVHIMPYEGWGARIEAANGHAFARFVDTAAHGVNAPVRVELSKALIDAMKPKTSKGKLIPQYAVIEESGIRLVSHIPAGELTLEDLHTKYRDVNSKVVFNDADWMAGLSANVSAYFEKDPSPRTGISFSPGQIYKLFQDMLKLTGCEALILEFFGTGGEVIKVTLHDFPEFTGVVMAFITEDKDVMNISLDEDW